MKQSVFSKWLWAFFFVFLVALPFFACSSDEDQTETQTADITRVQRSDPLAVPQVGEPSAGVGPATLAAPNQDPTIRLPPQTITSGLDRSDFPSNEPAVLPVSIDKTPDNWTKEDIKNALENNGWQIEMETETDASLVIAASKGDDTLELNYFKPAPVKRLRQLRRNAAIHRHGDIMIRVAVSNDRQASQELLNTLMGK